MLLHFCFKNHTLVFWRRFGESFKLWTQPLLSPTITIGSLVLYKFEQLSEFKHYDNAFFLIFCLFLAYWFYVHITTMRLFHFCSVLFVCGFLVLCKHDNLCIRSSKLTLKRVIISIVFQFHAKNVLRSFSSPQCWRQLCLVSRDHLKWATGIINENIEMGCFNAGY